LLAACPPFADFAERFALDFVFAMVYPVQ
jgi:hypothetical protein